MIPIRDLNPTRRRPLLTYVILGANVTVFLYQLSLPGPVSDLFLYRWGFVPYFFTQDFHVGSLSTPLTSMFLHGDLVHLASNMWFLYIFGDNVEDVLGRGKYVVFYLGTGFLAALAQLLIDPGSRIPMVGASGAIAGVLGAYIRLFPGARVHTIIPPFFLLMLEMPAVFFIFVWFLLQIFLGLGSLGLQGGVAFFAHIGGFLAGLWLVSILRPRVSRPPSARMS